MLRLFSVTLPVVVGAIVVAVVVMAFPLVVAIVLCLSFELPSERLRKPVVL